jgi:hypothetical protein
MATPALARSPRSDFRSEVKWVEESARDGFGRTLQLYVLQAQDGSVEGRPYLPMMPVVPRDRAAVPACCFTVRLRRRPDPDTQFLSPLIEQGLLTIELSLDLGLGAPYRPQFARDVRFTLESSGTQIADASSNGAGASVRIACTLESELALDCLGAFDGDGSKIGIRTTLDLQGTGSPTRYLKLEHSLDEIVAGLLDRIDRSKVVKVIVPKADGTGYEPLPPRVQTTRSRSVPGAPVSLPMMISKRGMTSVATMLAPRSLATSNTHALIASDAVQSSLTTPSGIHVALVNDIEFLPPLPHVTQLQLPVVTDPLVALFPDLSDGAVFWYPVNFTLGVPAPNDDPATSAFAFSFKRTGMTGGPVPRPTLSGSVRFAIKVGVSQDTKTAYASRKNAQLQPVPLNGLTVTLEVPYMDGGEIKFQSLRAELERKDDVIIATVPLLDDAVRMVYGSLAYPDQFQTEPAHVRVAYNFQAYVPIPQGWPHVIFGGKVALTSPELATRVGNLPDESRAMVMVKPSLLVSNQAVTGVQPPRYGVRSIAREQIIEAKFPCTSFGSFYLQDSDQGSTAVGCTDVLKLGEIAVKLYSEITELRDPSFRVLRALTQPELFLIVPTSYRITRFGAQDGADKAYRPSIMVYSVVDPDPAKNKFFFVAALQPDISVAARITLETALVSQSPHGRLPVIQYPTELSYVTSPRFSWILPTAMDQPTVQMFVESFSVGLTTGMDNALLLISLIQQSGMTGSVTFSLGDGSTLQSALILDTQIVGPWGSGPIETQIAADSVTLTNKIERGVNVFDVFTQRGTDAPNKIAVNTTLAPAASKSVPIQSPVDKACCSISVAPGPMKLAELDIFVEDVSTNVIFINQVSLDQHGLKGLSVTARLKGTDHIYNLNDVSGASTTLSITLPLTSYLAMQTLQYQINKIATDGSTVSTPWLEADLSKSNIVSITWNLIGN